MVSLSQLLAFSVGLVSGISHLYGALLGLTVERRSREVSRLFAALFFVVAWYCVWTGTRHAGLLDAVPALSSTSLLFAGYLGPLVYLFTRALLEPFTPIPRRVYWLLLFGLPGTYVFLYVAASPDPLALIRAAEAREWGRHPIGFAAFAFNALEIAGFVVVSMALAVRHRLRARTPEERSRALWASGPIVAALLALVVSNVLPLTPLGFSASALGPALTLPMMFLALAALRRAGAEHSALEGQRQAMSRYLPREVVERIADGRHRLSLGGETAVATVLFADIRGFTALAERLPPDRVVAGLNRYFSLMTDVVFRHGGMLDKFVGDALLAVFGVPENDGRDAQRALACGREMLEALETFNESWTDEGHPPLHIGIGLHRGRVVHGNVGSQSRMSYTVIGDTVNAASRLEALTKELGIPLLLTGEVADALGDETPGLACRGERMLRGKAVGTLVFSLTGASDEEPAGKVAS